MPNHYPNLNADKALIWRIVHRDNLPWILDNGLHCASSATQAPAYVTIGNTDLIQRRFQRPVPVAPGGTLADYVSFYFTPFSPMMYNIHTGRGGVAKLANENICILVSSLPRIAELGLSFVFTDRHAYTPLARYSNDIARTVDIDWPLLQTRNFSRSADDPEKVERYQAEALVYRQVPINALLGLICHTEEASLHWRQQIAARGLSLESYAMPGWYFQ